MKTFTRTRVATAVLCATAAVGSSAAAAAPAQTSGSIPNCSFQNEVPFAAYGGVVGRGRIQCDSAVVAQVALQMQRPDGLWQYVGDGDVYWASGAFTFDGVAFEAAPTHARNYRTELAVSNLDGFEQSSYSSAFYLK